MNKTVNIRVALGVSSDGNWGVYGYRNADNDEMQGTVLDMLDTDSFALHWITASVEIPESLEIPGVVEKAA